jgi:hypothetical protein
MPVAKPSSPPEIPAPLSADETAFIKETVKRFYGEDAVVRNYGPNPARMNLHVETDRDIGMGKYDCLGVLFTRIEREYVSLEVTRRGTRIHGNSKLAYRQGVIL